MNTCILKCSYQSVSDKCKSAERYTTAYNGNDCHNICFIDEFDEDGDETKVFAECQPGRNLTLVFTIKLNPIRLEEISLFYESFKDWTFHNKVIRMLILESYTVHVGIIDLKKTVRKAKAFDIGNKDLSLVFFNDESSTRAIRISGNTLEIT